MADDAWERSSGKITRGLRLSWTVVESGLGWHVRRGRQDIFSRVIHRYPLAMARSRSRISVTRRQLSSVVEQRFCKPSVVGSSPTAGLPLASSSQLVERPKAL